MKQLSYTEIRRAVLEWAKDCHKTLTEAEIESHIAARYAQKDKNRAEKERRKLERAEYLRTRSANKYCGFNP